ncbi:coiled-coil domain-containing protein 15 isoform X1 [Lates calcarifer]|uniref:Coiled-coil domain-containing protein 15 isoform X1 n=2 Tax=Lates calcarifer TaxID=8187 RepID=A0AAJ7Q5W9_LATCA|nr:coiled-coil domain-containing protein 15 isoform X1 [Lates calcarifer]
MSASRVKASTNGRNKASVSRSRQHRDSRANKVLAERNQAVVAVGAWVEDGQDFLEHPCALALLTEELQAERRRESEESLRRFQDEVRHRVAQRAQVFKKRQQPQTEPLPDRRIPQQLYRAQHMSVGEKVMSQGGAAQQKVMEGSSQESSEGMRQIRLRLAACRMIPHGEMTSDLPGGKWNMSPIRHKAESLVQRAEEEVREEEEDVQGEEEEEEGDDQFFTSQHECPLVQQKVSGRVSRDTDKSQPDPGSMSNHRVPQVLWPLADQEELKRQRQSHFLMHRRQFMNIEREQVKENTQHRKHLKRTARIKAEKEQIRLEEERKLERVRQLAEARQKLEERELLILERLRLEEEERATELQRKKKEKGKVATRYIEALRAQMKERLCPEKLELPPLCCCATSFWDSHPDTCANNCVFHNNPKAYAQALHSTMLSLNLR